MPRTRTASTTAGVHPLICVLLMCLFLLSEQAAYVTSSSLKSQKNKATAEAFKVDAHTKVKTKAKATTTTTTTTASAKSMSTTAADSRGTENPPSTSSAERSSSKSADPVGDTSQPSEVMEDKSSTSKTDLDMQIAGADTMIPSSYNKYRSPTVKGGVVKVHFRVLVQYFYSISQRDEVLDFGLKIFKMWTDPRLKKQNLVVKGKGKNDNEGIEVDPSLIWRPQSELRNAIERTVLSEELVIFPSGQVLLTQRLRVKVTVDFNMHWFPFDQQALTFVFGTFGRATTNRVQLVTGVNASWYPAFPGSAVKQNFLIESDLLERPQQSWKILSFYGKEAIVRGDASLLKYSEVNCILRVQRGRWHYIIVFCVPMFLIVLVSSANYNFDMRDLEPRVTVSASLLLALVALQYSIEQQLPSVTYIMWMNWYLFICYLTISLQVASFIIVVGLAGPQEDGTWTRKGHSDYRAEGMKQLDDQIQEIMGETTTNTTTGDIVLHVSQNDTNAATEPDASQPDIAKALGLGEAEAPLLGSSSVSKRKGKAIYIRVLTVRERRALKVDWYFRWTYPLLFILVTFCMFYSIPYHLRQGVVDKSEASQDEIDYEQGDRSNALKNVEVVDEDNSGGSEVSAVTDGSELPPDLKNARFVSTGH